MAVPMVPTATGGSQPLFYNDLVGKTQTSTPIMINPPAVMTGSSAAKDYVSKQASFADLTARKTAADETKKAADAAKLPPPEDSATTALKDKIQKLSDTISSIGQDAGTVQPKTNYTADEMRQVFGGDATGLHQNPDGTYTADDTALSRIGYAKNPDGTYAQGSATGTQNVSSVMTERDTSLLALKGKMDSIMNGTMPLSSWEQSQIDSTKASIDRAHAAQQIANQNYEGAVTRAGISAGRNRYAPEIEAGNLAAAVNSGIAKLQDIDNKGAQTLAKLEDAFRKNDYNQVNLLYKDLDATYSKKIDEMTKMNTAANTAANNLEKLKITTGKILLDAILKDATLDEKTKTDAIRAATAAGNLTEKERHNKEMELQKQTKTIKSGGLSITGADVASGQSILEKSRGSDGHADTKMYVSMLEHWQDSGGMLQDFIKQYPPKSYLNPNDSAIPQNIKSYLSKASLGVVVQ